RVGTGGDAPVLKYQPGDAAQDSARLGSGTADARARLVGMVVYRAREFLYQNRAAAASVVLGLVVMVVSLVVSGAWTEVPGAVIAPGVMVVAPRAVPLTISVEEQGTSAADSDAIIHVSLAGVMRRSIPLSDVSRIQRRDYRPFRE